LPKVWWLPFLEHSVYECEQLNVTRRTSRICRV